MGRSELEEVYDEYRTDSNFDHLRTPGIKLVPGFGSINPKVMIVGEAPGAIENTKVRPFCGPAGRVLNGLMEVAGLRLKDQPGEGSIANAFVTNVVKYRPPGNRTPVLREIEKSKKYLFREWHCIGRPRVIVACGAVAKEALYPGLGAISRVIGERIKLPGSTGTILIVQFHPSYGLRRQSERAGMERSWERMGESLREMEVLV